MGIEFRSENDLFRRRAIPSRSEDVNASSILSSSTSIFPLLCPRGRMTPFSGRCLRLYPRFVPALLRRSFPSNHPHTRAGRESGDVHGFTSHVVQKFVRRIHHGSRAPTPKGTRKCNDTGSRILLCAFLGSFTEDKSSHWKQEEKQKPN